MEPDNKTDDIPPLSDNYHKARRQYALFAALLLAWELIGLRLESEFFADRGLKILSPQAIPIVLIVLLAYFAYRTTIEWHQSDARRRTLRVSRLDFRIAHILALIAFGVFVVQRMLDVQLADEFERYDFYVYLLDFSAGYIVSWAGRILIQQRKASRLRRYIFLNSMFLSAGLLWFAYFFVETFRAGDHKLLAIRSMTFVAGIVLELFSEFVRRFVARKLGWANGESPDPSTTTSE